MTPLQNVLEFILVNYFYIVLLIGPFASYPKVLFQSEA